ncbi:MAG: class I SAM-dependent methyltransferase, partial [Treponema socranskii subsp. buccale]
NLFCYTGSFSVYAAEGGARTVDSVDLSNTYLDRAKENMRLNGFSDEKKYRFIRDDAAQFIVQKKALRERYDIIVLDPPTFSNSKMTHTVLDLAKDWPRFVNGCIALLAQGGVLYFSTNAKRLRFDESLIEMPANKNAITVRDITASTIPEDFLQKKPHRAWEIRRN